MSPSPRHPSSQDWAFLLLEAIQHRDAPRALELSLRCVHRQGMGALEAILDRADAATGQLGEARSWLLPLLKQGAPALATSPTFASEQPAPVPPIPLVSSSIDSDPKEGTEAPTTTPRADEPPFAEASPLEAESVPAPLDTFASETFWLSASPVASDSSSSAREPSREPASAPAPSERIDAHAKVSASAALDQAFAPLEIAFPPLPTVERAQTDPPTGHPPSSVPPPFSAPLRGLSARAQPSTPGEPSGSSDPSQIQDPAETPAPATRDQPFALAGAGDGEATAPAPDGMALALEKSLLDEFPKGHAAPVPTFQVEGFEESVSRSSRKSRQSDAPEEKKPTASRTLDAWRAWLPGPFRSRSRP